MVLIKRDIATANPFESICVDTLADERYREWEENQSGRLHNNFMNDFIAFWNVDDYELHIFVVIVASYSLNPLAIRASYHQPRMLVSQMRQNIATQYIPRS